jgi:trehalose synthase
MREIRLEPRPLAALADVLPAGQRETFEAAAASARAALAGRVIWNVNATSAGGVVAESLRTLLGYLLSAGIQARWLVLDGSDEFFAVTKCVHNAIHGFGDISRLGDQGHAEYQRTTDANAPDLLARVRSDDLVLLHDPQSAGLVPPLRQAGIPVAWRSHIGRDAPNEHSRTAWEFLRPYVQDADALAFSRPQYAPGWVTPEQLHIIPPSIDPLAAKNQYLSMADSMRALCSAGVLAADDSSSCPAVQGAPPPGPGARLVVQVSRWDRLKDMTGVMAGFATADLPPDAHLMLVGPAVTGVADDPEGAEVLAESYERWQELPARTRGRVSLVSLPMEDSVQNALTVNAIQRHATVVTQKSLAEGFGLTVAEAMWKRKPVIASAVGGIQDQITDGDDGLLIANPSDTGEFARALQAVIYDPDLADKLGQAARRRVASNYLDDRHFIRITELVQTMIAQPTRQPPGEADFPVTTDRKL